MFEIVLSFGGLHGFGSGAAQLGRFFDAETRAFGSWKAPGIASIRLLFNYVQLFQWNCNGMSVCVFVCMYKDASYAEDCLFMSNLIQLLLF